MRYLIKDELIELPYDPCALGQLLYRQDLDDTDRNAIMNTIKNDIHLFLQDGYSIVYLCTHLHLNQQQKKFIFSRAMPHLPALIQNGYQLALLLDLPFVKKAQVHDIFSIFQKKLFHLIRNAIDWFHLINASKLTPEQREYIFILKIEEVNQLIRNGSDLVQLLSLSFLTQMQRDMIWRRIRKDLSRIINSAHNLCKLLSISTLNFEQQMDAWLQAKPRLSELIQNGSQLADLLAHPFLILPRNKKFIFESAPLTQKNFLEKGRDLLALLSYREFTKEQSDIIFTIAEPHLERLISNGYIFKNFFTRLKQYYPSKINWAWDRLAPRLSSIIRNQTEYTYIMQSGLFSKKELSVITETCAAKDRYRFFLAMPRKENTVASTNFAL